MAANLGLRHRILRWLALYVVLLSGAVLVAGYVVHERVEHLAWESLLRAELDYFGQRTLAIPGYRWRDTEALRLFGVAGTPSLPPDLVPLPPGLHDDQAIDGRSSVVLRDQVEGRPVALALDLTEFETVEAAVTVAIVAGTITVIALLGLLVLWGLGRAIAPLSGLAQQVEALPAGSQRQVEVPRDASAELVVIADAFNDYLARSRRFVEREHAFIATASHELRTPLSVIAGAAELALGQSGLPPATRTQVVRIHRTARNVEQLVALLLLLARDPARLAAVSEAVALDQLLPDIVDDHRHLTRGKDLLLRLERPPPCRVVAPPDIVRAAIGNLLRNAIEHSDSGEIRVHLAPDATVVIEDPGHGMSPEEISAIYARVSRGAGDGGGIGLDLIARLCEHLGWTLAFTSTPGRGTTTTLRMAAKDADGRSDGEGLGNEA